MSEILIMGGTTFVSSHLAQHLINKGHEVDILTRGLIKACYTGFREHIICDRQTKDLEKLLSEKEYDYVFDISAQTKRDVELLLSSLNTFSLKKYVFCSSHAVYTPCDEPIKEYYSKGFNPISENYGLSKKEAENYLLDAYKKYNLPVVIIRPPHIYGEDNNLYREAYFFDSIRNKMVIPVPCGKNTLTQFIHVDDLVKVLESSLHNENKGKAYNVAYPEPISWYKLIKCCSDVVGEEAYVKTIDATKSSVEVRSFFPFNDDNCILDISQLIEDKFYVPEIDLEKGLSKTFKWYLENSPKLCDSRMNMINELIIEKCKGRDVNE